MPTTTVEKTMRAIPVVMVHDDLPGRGANEFIFCSKRITDPYQDD